MKYSANLEEMKMAVALEEIQIPKVAVEEMQMEPEDSERQAAATDQNEVSAVAIPMGVNLRLVVILKAVINAEKTQLDTRINSKQVLFN
jgi:hypothetical protein